MTAKELERQIEDMRIQFAKEHWDGNADNISRKDWLNIYILLLIKEKKVDKQNKKWYNDYIK